MPLTCTTLATGTLELLGVALAEFTLLDVLLETVGWVVLCEGDTTLGCDSGSGAIGASGLTSTSVVEEGASPVANCLIEAGTGSE